MSRRVLLLITHQSYRAEAFLAALAHLDLTVTVGTDREQALAFLNPAGNLCLDFADLGAAVAKTRAFHAEYPLDSVLAAEDDGVILAAAIAADLGLPGNPVQAVVDARDKHRSRQAWRAAGLPTPAFARHALDENPDDLAREIAKTGTAGSGRNRGRFSPDTPSYPCVLKPLTLAASRGVIRADDPADFVLAWRRLAAILARPETAGDAGGSAQQLLVEDYLPGAEYAVEGILTAGRLLPLAIFDKPDPLEGPFFEETIYLTPSRLPEPRRLQLLDAVQSAALALGLRHGPVHAELRMDGDRVWLLEIAPRSVGGHCGRSLRFVPAERSFETVAAGPEGPVLGATISRPAEPARGGPDDAPDHDPVWISLEALILRHALGEKTGSWRLESAASGVMMIPIPKAGVLRDVRGLEAARALPRVESVHMALVPGSPVEPPPEGAQYLGFIFARGETPDDVEAALRAAHQQLEFTIGPNE